MTDIKADRVPAGFEQLPVGLGFTDVLQPCYRKVVGENVSLGLVVTSAHLNSMGICHGGVLMTLADVAAASGANLARGRQFGTPTLNISLDFISAAREGEWLQAEIEGVSLKRLFGFSRGVISNAKGVVARFNGTFYFPEHEGLRQGASPGLNAMSGVQGLGE